MTDLQGELNPRQILKPNKRWWRTSLLWALALAISLSVVGTSKSFEACVRKEKNTKPYSALYQSPSVVRRAVVRLHLNATCAGQFTDENGAAIAALATIVLAYFTFTLWGATRGMLDVAGEQAHAMENSITQASRSAKAMESVANSMEENAERLKDTIAINREIADRQRDLGEMQLRAYLSALIGQAIYQERQKGLRFEGRAILVNQGHTPASRVRYRTRAAILPVPLPRDFELPDLPETSGDENMIGPQQNRTLSAVVADFVEDVEVDAIKIGIGKGLYLWGEILYVDAFRHERSTTFCHHLTWRGEAIWGYYIPNRNNST